MERRLRLLVLSSVVAITLQAFGGLASAVQVSPGQGLSFNQVDYTFTGATALNSDTGEIVIDAATLQAATSTPSGYVNVSTAQGWVVQNVPVLHDYPYSTISTMFELSSTSGTDITSLSAFVDFSATASTSFVGGSPTSFPVGDSEFNAEGKASPTTVAPSPPPPGVVSFDLGGAFSYHWKLGVPNIQTAKDQCGPAAAANSLKYLEDTFNIPMNHPHAAGLGCPLLPVDGTRVGELDRLMNRTCTNRAVGNGVTDLQFLSGKLDYLRENNLDDDIVVKHQDVGPGGPGGGNHTFKGVTSKGEGVPSIEFIRREIEKSEDVEIGYTRRHPDGKTSGHWVTAAGVGHILGRPFLFHRSDQRQTNTDPGDNIGTEGAQFGWLLKKANGDVHLQGVGKGSLEATGPQIDIVVAESPRIPPTGANNFWRGLLGLAAAAFGVLLMARARVSRRLR